MITPEHIAIYLCYPVDVPCWNFTQREERLLQELLPATRLTCCRTEAEFLAALADADACLVWNFRQEWLAQAPKLRLISTPSAGKDYFHLQLPPGVYLMNGQFHGQIIAETVAGYLLGMARGLFPCVARHQEDAWPRSLVGYSARRLAGSHVVILGFGHIGQQIGKVLKGFGCWISGMKRRTEVPRPAWFTAEDQIFSLERLEEVLPTADHVVLALPNRPDTDNLLDRRRLALLPRWATVSNIGRGNSIDETALCEALREHRLAGACLDVFAREPLAEGHPFLTCPNLWHFPHSSAIAPEYLQLYVRDFVRQLSLPPPAQDDNPAPTVLSPL